MYGRFPVREMDVCKVKQMLLLLTVEALLRRGKDVSCCSNDDIPIKAIEKKILIFDLRDSLLRYLTCLDAQQTIVLRRAEFIFSFRRKGKGNCRVCRCICFISTLL